MHGQYLRLWSENSFIWRSTTRDSNKGQCHGCGRCSCLLQNPGTTRCRLQRPRLRQKHQIVGINHLENNFGNQKSCRNSIRSRIHSQRHLDPSGRSDWSMGHRGTLNTISNLSYLQTSFISFPKQTLTYSFISILQRLNALKLRTSVYLNNCNVPWLQKQKLPEKPEPK